MIHLPPPRLCPCGIVHRIPPRTAHDLRPFDLLFLTNTMKNLMLGAIATASATNPDFGSLHTAYSTTGTSEVTGGSPAYARAALTWASPSGGSVALAATLPTWNVPAATTVTWWGMWDASTSGTFLGMLPLGAGSLQPAAVEVSGDLTSNLIFAKAHGFTAGKRVVFWGTLPTGLSREDATNGPYYVIAAGLTADAFSVSTSAGGSAVDITGTAPYTFFVQGCTPEVFAGQGTYSLTSGSVDLAAVA